VKQDPHLHLDPTPAGLASPSCEARPASPSRPYTCRSCFTILLRVKQRWRCRSCCTLHPTPQPSPLNPQPSIAAFEMDGIGGMACLGALSLSLPLSVCLRLLLPLAVYRSLLCPLTHAHTHTHTRETRMQMMATMGIPVDFSTTKGKGGVQSDKAAQAGGVRIKPQRDTRQYMNRS
jgi:hypothetical protein